MASAKKKPAAKPAPTPGEKRGRGRPRGSTAEKTREREATVERYRILLNQKIPGAFEGDAHAFLMAVYKDPRVLLETRLDAAKSAIRYEKPALAAIAHTGTGGGPLTMITSTMTPQEAADAYSALVKGNVS